jgi:hypothetical protein
MEQLELIAVELEEAGRLIKVGRIPHLRLAFLLLDNAAEVMMHRAVQDETQLQGVYRNLRREMLSMQSFYADNADFMDQLRDIEGKVLPERTLDRLDAEFRAKANFLVERGLLDSSLATIVKKLHRYRNELYHEMHIRKAVLEPATLVYFDVACSLLVTSKRPRSYSSGESYIDLSRFGVTHHDAFADDTTARVAAHLRTEVGMDIPKVRAALVDHLTGRLDDLDEVIYMIHAALPDRYRELNDAIHVIQTNWADELIPVEELRRQRFPVSARKLRLWRKQVASLADIADRYAMFARFAAIEDAFETFEARAQDLYDSIERTIQSAIDQEDGR